jgi:hypothetical protein
MAALARLAGLGGGAPRCEAAQSALGAALTGPLATRIADPDPRALLGDLNSAVLTPQVGLLAYRGPVG